MRHRVRRPAGPIALRLTQAELDRPGRPRPHGGPRWEDEARFIRTWLENPKGTGAVSPSGRALSRMIARQVDPAIPGPVIELGPGTGPVTAALIRHGIAPERLVLLEYETVFCKLLARRYPQVRIVQGDAYALRDTLAGLMDEPAAAVVSSLPLLNRRERDRRALLEDAFALMAPGAPFVQFTYGLASPIPRYAMDEGLAFEAQASPPVLMNLPPARVWTYRAADAASAPDDRRADLMVRLRLGRERLADEVREHRARLRAEWMARSAETVAEWKAKAEKVRSGLARHGARLKARDRQGARPEQVFDRRHPW